MPHIRHRLTIDAPKETVHEAISTTDGLAGWWTPEVNRRNDKTLLFGFGPDYTKTMNILKEKVDRVEWKCTEAHPEWIDTVIRFDLKESEGVTKVIFSHDKWKEYSEMFAICNFNWALFLRSLKLLCEKGKGRPHPNQMDI